MTIVIIKNMSICLQDWLHSSLFWSALDIRILFDGVHLFDDAIYWMLGRYIIMMIDIVDKILCLSDIIRNSIFFWSIKMGLGILICSFTRLNLDQSLSSIAAASNFMKAAKIVITFIIQDFMAELDIQIPIAFGRSIRWGKYWELKCQSKGIRTRRHTAKEW